MYIYFDAHCDTLSKMYKKRIGISSSELMVNTNNLKAYKSVIQVFALFNNGELNKKAMTDCFEYFKNECKKLSDKVLICTSATEIDKNIAPLSAILAIEALGNQPDFKICDIPDYYNIGVRFMSLCWNGDNVLCGGCEGENTGLTNLGIQALNNMEEYKIILDVSHMSDKSFWESFENYSLPICATHSVSRFVHTHVRNLTDEQFKAIRDRKGVCGINFYPPFLCSGDATLDDVVNHIEHFMSLGGEDCIGLGSDFDGIPTAVEWKDAAGMDYLLDGMEKAGFTERECDKICRENVLRLYKECL